MPWPKGFTPGKHCTDVSHHVKNELADLPARLHRDDTGRPLYVCNGCLQKTLLGLRRSAAAKRGVETRRRLGGKRAPRG